MQHNWHSSIATRRGRHRFGSSLGFVMTSLCAMMILGATAFSQPATLKELNEARRVYIPIEEFDIVTELDHKGVVLPRDKFNQLLTQAKENAEKNPVPTGVAVVLNSADYVATIQGNQLLITVTAELNQFDNDWRETKLSFQRLSIEQAKVGDQPAMIGRHADGSVSLLTHVRGQHKLTLQLSTELTSQGSDQIAAFSLINAPSGTFKLSVPAGKRLIAGSLQLPRPTAIDQAADYQLAIGGLSAIQLRITDRTTSNTTDSLMFASTGYGLNVAPGEVTWNALTTVQVFGSPVNRLMFSIPKSLEIAEVTANGLENWSLADDANAAEQKSVTLTFGQAFDGVRKITLRGVMTTETGKTWTVPSLKIEGTTSHIGQIIIQHRSGVRLRIEEAVGVRRATKEQKPAADMPDEIEADPTNFIRFDAWQPEFRLRLRTQLKERELQAAIAAVMEINSTGLDLEAALTVEPHFTPLFDLDVRLPAEWQVLDVQKDQQPLKWQLNDWDVPGTRQLRIALPAPIPAGAQGVIRLTLRRDVEGWPVEVEPITVPLPELFLPQANLTEGEFVVRAEDDLELLPLEVRGLDSQPLKADYERLRFRSQDTHFEAKLQITRKPSRIATQTVAFARMDHQTFHTFLQAIVEVQGGGTRSIKATLPESVGASVRFECDEPKIVEQKSAPPQNGERVWTLQFGQRLRGRAVIVCDIETPRGDQTDFVVPLFQFVDAERQSSFIAIEASSEQWMTTTADDAQGNPLMEADPLELPSVQYRPKERIVAVYRSSSPKPSIRLTEQRFDKIPVPIAVCPKLSISTILGRAGERQHRATFQIQAVGVQGLHLTFPQPVVLWATTLNDRPVEVRRNGDVYLIPYVLADSTARSDHATPAGGHTATLQLFYQSEKPTSSGAGRLKEEPPRLTVESGQRTAAPIEILSQDWNLYYPSETRVVENHSVLEPREPLDTTSFTGRLNSQFRTPTEWQLFLQLVAIGIVFGAMALIGRMIGQRRFIAATGLIVACVFGLFIWGFRPAEKLSSRAESSHGKFGLEEENFDGPAKGVGGFEINAGPMRQRIQGLDMAQPPAVREFAPAEDDKKKEGIADEDKSRHAGRLSLAVDFNTPAGSRQKTFSYVGADESSSGVALDVDFIDQSRGMTVRFFVMSLVILIGWWMRKVCIGSKIALVTLAAVPALALIPFVPTGWQFVLDGVLLGTIICIVIWTICVTCHWTSNLCSTRLRFLFPASTAVLAAALTLSSTADAADPQAKSKPDPVIIIPFDAASEPLASERIFLSHDQYRSLLQLANPDVAVQPAPQKGGVFGALYAVELVPNAQVPEQSSARVKARYAILSTTDNPISLELPIGAVSATSATLDGKQAALTAVSNRLTATVSKSGVHVLDFVFEVPARLFGPSGSLALPLLPVSAGKLTMKLPAKDLSIRVNGSTTVYRRVTEGEAQSLELPIDKGGDVAIAWQPQQSQGSESAVINVDSVQAVTLNDAGASVSAGFGLRVRNGTVADSTFSLPSELRLQGVSGPDVGGWEVQGEGAARSLKVTYRRNVNDQTHVLIDTFLDVKVSDTAQQVTVPSIAPQNVSNEIGQLALFAAGQYSIHAEKTESLSQIDTNKFSTPVAVNHPKFAPTLAYRFSKRPFAFVFRAARRESQAHVTAWQAALITLRKQQLTARFKFNLTGSPRSSLNIKLPPNFVLLNVESSDLRDWYTTKQGDNVELTIELQSPKLGDLEVAVVGFVPRDSNPTNLQFPQPMEATQLNSTTAIWLEEGMTGTLDSIDGWRSIDPVSAPDPLRAVRSQSPIQFALSSTQLAPSAITINVSQTEPKLTANGLSMVTVTDESVVYTLALQWQIESAKVDQLVLTTPGWLANRLDFLATGLGEVSQATAAGDRIRWTLHLRTPTTGPYFVTAVASLPSNLKEVVAPSIIFEANQKPIELQGQYLLLINSSSGQLTSLDTSLVEPAQSSDLPVVVEKQLIDQATELVRIKTLSTSPRWSIQSYARQPGAPASVNLADLTTVISRDGTYRSEAIYTIKNRTRQFLALQMPDSTDLVSIFVADQPSRAVTTKLPSQGGNAVQLIALPKTSEASLSFRVRVSWRGRLNHALPSKSQLLSEEYNVPAPKILSLQDDANFGIPVAQTRWTVYLPHNLDAAPVRSITKHNLSLAEHASEIDLDTILQDLTELGGTIEQTVTRNRRQSSTGNLKQLAVARNNLIQLRQQLNAKSGGVGYSDSQNRLSEIESKLHEAEQKANDELSRIKAESSAGSNSLVTDSLNEGQTIAIIQQNSLIQSNGIVGLQLKNSAEHDSFEFRLPEPASNDQRAKKGDLTKTVPEQKASKSEAREQLRRSNTQSLTDLNSSVTDNSNSRQSRMETPQIRMDRSRQAAPNSRSFTTNGVDVSGNGVAPDSQLWTNGEIQYEPLTAQNEKWHSEEPMQTMNDVERALVGNGVFRQNRVIPGNPLPGPADEMAQVDQAAPPQQAGLGVGGTLVNRKPNGGLSLSVELAKSGRPLIFTKTGGDPKLALAIRPASTSQFALRLLWSLVWIVLFFGIYYTLGRPEWKRTFLTNLPYGLALIGTVAFLALPAPISFVGFLTFIAAMCVLLRRRVRTMN